MTTPRFTWTDRARPIIQLGIGDRTEYASARWDSARWDDPAAVWSGVEPQWQDVGCDAFTFRCEYGRQRSTDRFVVGQASLVVWNATGWADPYTVDEPGVLTMRPGRAIRVGVEHVTLGVRWIFRGFVDAMTPVYDPTQADTVELSCIDALGEVNRAKTQPIAPPSYAGDTVDVRIARLLDLAQWATSARDLSPTGDTLIASDMGGQVADLLGQAADSGGGNVFGDLSGRVAYRARDWQTFLPGSPPDGSIGNVDTVGSPGYTIPGTPAVDAYLDLTKGTLSTLDTADMSGTVALRLTVRARFDTLPAAVFPTLVTKQGAAGVTAREYQVYTSGTAAYASSTGLPGAASTNLPAVPTLSLGEHTIAVEMSTGSSPAVAVLDGVRTARTWSPDAPLIPDTTASVVIGGVTAGRTGRLYSAQLERLSARLAFPGIVGNYVSAPMTTPNGDIEIIARLSAPDWTPAAVQTVASRWIDTPTNNRSWLLRLLASGVLQLNISSDGTNNALAASTVALGFLDGTTRWVRVTRVQSTGVVTFYTAPDSEAVPATWTQLGSTVTLSPTIGLFAGAAPVTLGAFNTSASPWNGQIRRLIVRGVIGGAAVLDVHEDNAANPSSATTFRASTGQTMTVTQTTGQTVVQPQPDRLVWRFDAADYPGTGTGYVDPRGRTWTLSTAGVIAPAVPAVPDVVVPAVPGDVCPVRWERPFARADLATRVIIGRDPTTAQVLDDVDGQNLYGIEPFERTDLLTERDDRITLLGQRILRVRSAHAAPRVRSVTLDARTSDAALDMMASVDVFKPSRYRCRLRYPEPRGLVFDVEHIATGVVHDLSPTSWQTDVNLDVAEPYAAAGGHWDGATWDQSTWAS